MEIKFTKMHGIGNDYVYINCFEENLDGVDISKLAVDMSKRRFSVGSDGVILICPSENCDARMRMFNADGSEGKMCGNGIRCVAKYCYDFGIAKKDVITIETLSGVKTVKVTAERDKLKFAEVNMGKAELDPKLIPVISPTNRITLKSVDKTFDFTCVSMGNPHAVTYVDDLEFDIERYGAPIEKNTAFPDRVNVEFVKVVDKATLRMRVWERGSGETYACGTGACAIAVSSVLNGICDYNTPVTVKLLGGDLKITVRDDLTVFMEGPAEISYRGVYEYED